jgi:uncharacterized protein (DUF362 family)
MDNQVSIVSCPDYGQVIEKMDELISMMGGMSQFVKPGERIVLKANLLQPAKPEQAVTTHPGVVAAVAATLRKQGVCCHRRQPRCRTPVHQENFGFYLPEMWNV